MQSRINNYFLLVVIVVAAIILAAVFGMHSNNSAYADSEAVFPSNGYIQAENPTYIAVNDDYLLIYDATQNIVSTAKAKIPNLAIIQIIGDGMGYNSHPSAVSHQIIANKLTKFIEELLDK